MLGDTAAFELVTCREATDPAVVLFVVLSTRFFVQTSTSDTMLNDHDTRVVQNKYLKN